MRRTLLLAVCLGCSSIAWADEPAKPYTQAPEIVPAAPRGETPAVTAETKAGSEPQWIWGDKADTVYFVRKTFPGGSKSARLMATCDNRMTVWLNGEQIAESGSWEVPVQKDVQKWIKEGDNELLVRIANEGGQSGFLLQLTLTGPDEQVRTVVTDASWKAAETRDGEGVAVKVLHKYGEGPWGAVFSGATASRGAFQVQPGFQVERLFTVPKDELGSWVSMAVDPKGRLIVSDQDKKGLCRITPSPLGSMEPTKVERLDVKITSAQGLLFAFGSLYVSVNGEGSGIYRVRDTDDDDQFDEVVKVMDIPGGAGEHGIHSLRLSPDGQSIYLVAGNHTPVPKGTSSRIPGWDEDFLIPRQWDANGHAVGILAPGGWVARMDPEGKSLDIVSMGYRNSCDMAFNADGELFVYDSDMEWDMGAPWYRPTRVVHATLGSEFGWRSGTACWPAYYVDSLPPMVEIGPGSPVGVTFGYGAKFPAKYQKALFLCDWTFGTMYAVHMEPDGASYKGTKEEFLSRTPLPLTDALIGLDGAMYFTVGGRGTQSELFRVTYIGNDSTETVDVHDPRHSEERAARRVFEARMTVSTENAPDLEPEWKNFGHPDRFMRFAARIALEHQPVGFWRDRVFTEPDPIARITAAVALARQGDKSLQPRLIAALNEIDTSKLTDSQLLDLLRAYELTFIRMGMPPVSTAVELASKFSALYPSKNDFINRELCNLLSSLPPVDVIEKTIALLQQKREVAAEEIPDLLARNPGYGGSIRDMLKFMPDAQKLHYVFALRNIKTGWTLPQRKAYFDAIAELRTKKGGSSYLGFLRNIDREAFEAASEPERLAIEASGARPPYKAPELPKPTGPGKPWTLDELLALSKDKLKGRDFKTGQKMFAATRCIICHRFAGDGGATGPDLTQAAGRFSLKDLVEATVDPGKVVSDQYRAHVVSTTDGLTHTGRLLSNNDQGVTILTDPEDPTKQVMIPKDKVEEVKPSQISLMPKDLLGVLNEDEVLDLLAYLLSRGNPNDPVFRR